MHYITLQNRKIPALGFGTYKLTGGDCTRAVRQAFDIGYRHIDTAQIYDNEEAVGDALPALPREEIFLTTKVWTENVRDGDLQRSVDDSLKRLKTDYVDLLLIHWPVADVPLRDQMRALASVQQAGKAKLIGVSNFTVAMMRECVETLGVKLINNQVEYHPFLSQRAVLDYTRKHGLFVTAYSPLARGGVDGHPALQEIAGRYGKSAGQVTLRWLIQQDHVAAIPKAASEKHMRANFEIFDFALTEDEMQSIHALARPDGRLIDPDWGPEWDVAA